MTTNLPDPDPYAEQGPEPERAVIPRWILGVACAVAVVVAAVLAVVIATGSSTPSPTAALPANTAAAPSTSAPTATPAELDIVRRTADDPLAIGRVDAPVVLMWWADLRCPFCAMFSTQTLPTLLSRYVKTGKVRIEVHEVGYFGEESIAAAIAARAAGNQGRFFPYLRAVYAAAPHHGHPAMPERKLIRFARRAGVADLARFGRDLHSPDLRAAVLRSTQQAQQFGVGSVPFFVAGRTSLAGAQPTEIFERFIDNALIKAR